MTREEAYNSMQEGYLVSHKDLGMDSYIYMDSLYIMRDENDKDFESTWDAWDLNGDSRWDTGWYIYKGAQDNKKEKRKWIMPFVQKEEVNAELISHIQGKPCPGKKICVQHCSIGATACLVCDVNDDKRLVDAQDILAKIDMNEFSSDSQISKRKSKAGLISKIKNRFKSLK